MFYLFGYHTETDLEFMNKSLLLNEIVTALEMAHQTAIAAAMQAYKTATGEANVAENKYDTLGLEASYLAQGQAQRVVECMLDVTAFQQLETTSHCPDEPISTGALICLVDRHGLERRLLLGPSAGGLNIVFDNKKIVVITPSSPLGKALFGQYVDDEVEITVAGEKQVYKIVSIN